MAVNVNLTHRYRSIDNRSVRSDKLPFKYWNFSRKCPENIQFKQFLCGKSARLHRSRYLRGGSADHSLAIPAQKRDTPLIAVYDPVMIEDEYCLSCRLKELSESSLTLSEFGGCTPGGDRLFDLVSQFCELCSWISTFL